jgi:hypothetical protein
MIFFQDIIRNYWRIKAKSISFIHFVGGLMLVLFFNVLLVKIQLSVIADSNQKLLLTKYNAMRLNRLKTYDGLEML